MACPCGGRRRVLAVVVDSALARPARGARSAVHLDDLRGGAAPPQAELWFDNRSMAPHDRRRGGQGRICAEVEST